VVFVAILRFLSPNRIFTYLRRRHPSEFVTKLNYLLKTRYKVNDLHRNRQFLKDCLSNDVAPRGIQRRISKAKLSNSTGVERIFLKDEIRKVEQEYLHVKDKFVRLYSSVKEELSFCDFVRFSTLLSNRDVVQQTKLTEKYDNVLSNLKKLRFGNSTFNHDYIINLSSIELTDVQKDVLSKGTDFSVPPHLVREEVLTEYELLYQSLAKHEPSATVVMSRSDYVGKMMTILDDESKFERLGPAADCDRTVQIEQQFQGSLICYRRNVR